MVSFLFYVTMIAFLVICLFLILLILIQKGRGGGLSSAFGGAGGNTAFGSKTGDVLTWATSIVFALFLVLAVGLNLLGDVISRPAAVTQAPVDDVTTEDTTPLPTAPERSTPTNTTPTTAPSSVAPPTTSPATTLP